MWSDHKWPKECKINGLYLSDHRYSNELYLLRPLNKFIDDALVQTQSRLSNLTRGIIPPNHHPPIFPPVQPSPIVFEVAKIFSQDPIKLLYSTLISLLRERVRSLHIAHTLWHVRMHTYGCISNTGAAECISAWLVASAAGRRINHTAMIFLVYRALYRAFQ